MVSVPELEARLLRQHSAQLSDLCALDGAHGAL